MKHWTAILLSGISWLAIGTFLLMKGFKLIIYGSLGDASTINSFQNQTMILISSGLLIGYIKARYVMIRSIKKIVERILSKPEPIQISKIYSKGYFFLIFSMVLLGVMMRFLPISFQWRGSVDLAIGSALINGFLIFLRFAFTVKNKTAMS